MTTFIDGHECDIATVILSALDDSAMQDAVDEVAANIAQYGERVVAEDLYLFAGQQEGTDNLASWVATLIWAARQQKTTPTVQYGHVDDEGVLTWSDVGAKRRPSHNLYRHVTMGETIPLSKED